LEKELNKHVKENVEQLLQTAEQSLSVNANKNVRKTTKVKILIALKKMAAIERDAAIEGMCKILLETEDPCLQNYLVDILLCQCSPKIDNRLMQIISSSNGRIADFVKTYVTGMLNQRGYENIYHRC
jgi:hypothetical protein